MTPFTSRDRVFLLFLLLLIAFVAHHASFTKAATAHDGERTAPYSTKHAKVPLEAHIMSKCPDAAACVHDLIIPTMQNVSDKVDFRLSYIGEATNHDDGVTCKHGQTECLGNILELCAADLYLSPRIYLGFTMCLFNDYTQIPGDKLVKGCALEHGIDFEKLNNCASKEHGEYGMALLRKSVKRSSEAGVDKSCTVRLNGTFWCVRDGGEWKGCDDGSKPKNLIKAVNKMYKDSSGDSDDMMREL